MTALARRHLAAVVPSHADPPAAALLAELAGEVGAIVLVDDGMPAAAAALLARRARAAGASLVRLPTHAGKGHALVAGIAVARSLPGIRAVATVDADGQHPPAALPEFRAAAAQADLVIGDRLAGAGHMPLVRLLANHTSSALVALRTGHAVPDSQCGMRLLHRRALVDVPFCGGGMEAETLHLMRCLRAGVPVAWVPIPAIYAGEHSAFRPVRDSAGVVAAALRG